MRRGSWLRPPPDQRASGLPAMDLFAQQFVVHAQISDQRFGPLCLFIAIGFPRFQVCRADLEELIPPAGRRCGGHAQFGAKVLSDTVETPVGSRTICAPSSAAWLESVTVPMIVPALACALADEGHSRTHSQVLTLRTSRQYGWDVTARPPRRTRAMGSFIIATARPRSSIHRGGVGTRTVLI